MMLAVAEGNGSCYDISGYKFYPNEEYVDWKRNMDINKDFITIPSILFLGFLDQRNNKI